MSDREAFWRNKTAVVTGAGGALGSAIAKELDRRGARVALLGRSRDKLDVVASTMGAAFPLSVDCIDAAAVADAARTITAELGAADFLVNAAGGNQAEAMTTLTEFDPAELEGPLPDNGRGFFNLDLDRCLDVIAVNAMGTVIPCQVFGRDMARHGRGAIVNFASMNSYRPLSRVPAYAMAKAGIVNFTQWLAAYLASAGVRVNAVAPGFFINDRSRRILMDERGDPTSRGERIIAHTPMRRFGEPRDLLGCVCWLLDDEQAAFVTGITLPVDGGFLSSAGV